MPVCVCVRMYCMCVYVDGDSIIMYGYSAFLTGISNGLNFVHVKVVDNGIKAGVEVIEEVNHLQWGAGPSNACEPNNVTATREKSLFCVCTLT